MKTKQLIINIFTLCALTLGLLNTVTTPTRAEETTGEKIQNNVDNATRNTKKTYRKTKKQIRDSTGNSSIKEDLHDDIRNLDDSTGDAVKKLKRKVD